MFGNPAINNKQWPESSLLSISKEPPTYGVAASAIKYDGKIRYIRITDIQDDGSLGTDVVSPDFFSDQYMLNDHDLLFARTGSVGRTFLYTSHDGKSVFAGYLIRFVPDTNKINPVFLYHYTQSDYYWNFVDKMKHGGVQANINAKQYGSLKVILPPLSLQSQFVDFVNQVDKSKFTVKHCCN